MLNEKAYRIAVRISMMRQPTYRPNKNPYKYTLEQEKYRNDIYSLLDGEYPQTEAANITFLPGAEDMYGKDRVIPLIIKKE